MKLKPNDVSRSFTCLGWTAALGLLEFITPTVVTSAPTTPFDEPPCYMRTQDGSIVNLQSLCRRSTVPQTQSSPATNQPPQSTASPQAAPTQRLPTRSRDLSGSHTQGNPDSDDGRY
ncbi:hypothetical protein [Stenomitos frigidus]|uniref:Uncharacterized protein n=1 Tax=Stenomitos frigidus ULC18 TaxID=2107698 RepID=A0A2T1EC42_9CYAN|nr:hypothetical protein [Stenomitos frigidus]PSB30265.1 hypothetical protein C7B82_09290 [Stenomitos frigidus ULC18]